MNTDESCMNEEAILVVSSPRSRMSLFRTDQHDQRLSLRSISIEKPPSPIIPNTSALPDLPPRATTIFNAMAALSLMLSLDIHVYYRVLVSPSLKKYCLCEAQDRQIPFRQKPISDVPFQLTVTRIPFESSFGDVLKKSCFVSTSLTSVSNSSNSNLPGANTAASVR